MFDFNSLKGKAVLAPLAGVGDSAFRSVCAEAGAACTVSEMVSAKALHYGDKSTAELMYISASERPCGIQLFGSEPEIMAEGAKIAAEYNPDFIDINMGCPVPKITGGGDGSSLLKDEVLAGKIMEAVAKAVALPVSVKVRIGWSDEEVVAPRFTHIARECGLKAIAVHGRSKKGGYTAPVNYEVIAQCAAEKGIFVIGNGGVFSAEDFANMLSTGCGAVMVGRGALGNPLIFREIVTGQKATDAERLKLFLEQTARAVEQKGEKVALREARKHAGFYLRGVRSAAEFRRRGSLVTTYAELEQIVGEALAATEE